MNESESLALLMTDKVENLSKSIEKQTDAINQLINIQKQSQHSQQSQQPQQPQQPQKQEASNDISQNYFKNVLRNKILDICPDFITNPEKTWKDLNVSHVDEVFEIKSNYLYKSFKKVFSIVFFRTNETITASCR